MHALRGVSHSSCKILTDLCALNSTVRISLIRRTIMKAIRVHQFGAPEVMKVEQGVPVPKPADDQVLIKVHATGVNPVDTYIRSGTYARKPELPYTPGSDSAGVVEAVGKNVTNFKKGDRAYTTRSVSGTCAEFTTSEALYTGHLADRLTFNQGAALGVPYYTAYRALFTRARISPGETILIHGASGAVGLAAVQMARSQGLRVLGTASSQKGLDLIKASGASDVFNHRQEGYTDSIMKATGGVGPDVIIEMLSNVNLQNDLEMLKAGGRIAVIGCRGTVEINPRLLMAKECQVMGVMLGGASPADWREMHAFLEAGGAGGWVNPHVSQVYSLDQAPAAHNDVINNSGAAGKLVITI